jgi:hypothetical protein
MKKLILLFLLLALNINHCILASQNSQATDSQETQLDDDAIAWLFSSQNPNNHPNHPLQNQNNESPEAQINDGYNYDFSYHNSPVEFDQHSQHEQNPYQPRVNIVSRQTTQDNLDNQHEPLPHHQNQGLIRTVTLETINESQND